MGNLGIEIGIKALVALAALLRRCGLVPGEHSDAGRLVEAVCAVEDLSAFRMGVLTVGDLVQ